MIQSQEYLGKDAYIDREHSWLSFNQRVLDEALDASVPLLVAHRASAAGRR